MSALSWAWYAVVVSLLLAGSALAAERGARALRWSGRWPWAAALVASLGLPALAYLRPPAAEPVLTLLAPIVTLPAIGAGAAGGGGAAWAWLPLGWLAASAAVLLLLVAAHAALLRARRGWRAVEVDGTRVWVSPSVGPALFGVLRPEIVVPEWLLGLHHDARRLLLLHEEQHRAAGDSRLLLGGLLACAAMPWNPVLWWQLKRLRAAMELDCDARVLGRVGEPVAYGQLLLEVGRRRSERHLALTAFAEPRVLLERRVRALITWPARRRPVAGALSALAAVLLFGWACAARDPLAMNHQAPVNAAVVEQEQPLPAKTVTAVDSGSRFTPMTVRPELRNASRIRELLVENYPPLLRDAGIGGAAVMWFHIDAQGVVTKVELSRSSGYPALDEAALRVARAMEFSSAYYRETPVAVWVEIPIVFSAAGGQQPKVRAERAPERTPEWVRALAGEGFDLRTVTNAAELAAQIAREYPPLLRDAGIGGQATIAFLVSAEGRPLKVQLSKSSGYTALDEAALRLAAQARFAPGEKEGWVQIPFQFTAK